MLLPLFPLLFLAMKSNQIYTFILEFHDKEGLLLVDFTTERIQLLWNLGAAYNGSQSGVPESEHRHHLGISWK